MNVLITGCFGFIGFNLSNELLKDDKYSVIGLDNDRNSDWIKRIRANQSKIYGYDNSILDNKSVLAQILKENNIDTVIHLAAKTGVRPSFNNKKEYIDANVFGFTNILDAMLEANTKNIIYASSSSIFGNSQGTNENEQESIYAITKRTDELIANMYSRQFGLNCIGLRFFTVYGEFGRFDMFPVICVNKLLSNKEITVFGNGEVSRDFTYINDVVFAIKQILNNGFQGNNVYNIGSGFTVNVVDFVNTLASKLNRTATITYKERPIQDVMITKSDVSQFEKDFCVLPHTPTETGLDNFSKWILDYENICINDFTPQTD